MKMVVRKHVGLGRWAERQYDLPFVPAVGTNLDGERVMEVRIETLPSPAEEYPRGGDHGYYIVLVVGIEDILGRSTGSYESEGWTLKTTANLRSVGSDLARLMESIK